MIEHIVKYAQAVLSDKYKQSRIPGSPHYMFPPPPAVPSPAERAQASMPRDWNPFRRYTKPGAGFGHGDMRDWRLPHEQWFRDIGRAMIENNRPIISPERARELMQTEGGWNKLRSYTTPTEIDTPWYVDLFT